MIVHAATTNIGQTRPCINPDAWDGSHSTQPKTSDAWDGSHSTQPKTSDAWDGSHSTQPKTSDAWDGSHLTQPEASDARDDSHSNANLFQVRSMTHPWPKRALDSETMVAMYWSYLHTPSPPCGDGALEHYSGPGITQCKEDLNSHW